MTEGVVYRLREVRVALPLYLGSEGRHLGTEPRELGRDRICIGDLPRPQRAAGSSDFGGGTRRLARMLASAPMIPTPANMTSTPTIRPRVVTG